MLRRIGERGAEDFAPARSRELSDRICLAGLGVEIPEASISNEELVDAFNRWVGAENMGRAERGEEPLPGSSADFIVHASGIRRRHVYEREGILDPARMAPVIPARGDGELSVMAEFGLKAARKALAHAKASPRDIDLVICSAAHHQRPYPAIAIEIQQALGAEGAAFDMGLGCSSALAGLHMAANLVRAGAHRRILVVTPELITAHLNFRDRQTHFIFGDAAVAFVVEAMDQGSHYPGRFEVVDTRLWTQFSSNIRTNFGFMSRLAQEDPYNLAMEGQLIKQIGNKVFKEVTVAGHQFIVEFLAEYGHTPHTMRRFWLHQANARMNAMILKLAFGEEVGQDRAPTVLERLGNTAAAGAVIALAENHEDMEPGQFGLLCAFGAGYSIGGALLRMM
ncbi:beta-ketoacyl-ACP synthase III [Chelativorans sp. AA-79]|uniref:beta-ketoacyl-ACP synthase III n=1 Tax=Chelativorans sp. AA-79 TaxID=3028735 RepID=UPI0023F961DE|nr:beta-ketoacyl-ACP synthase III [Chelativorans sp. AA-79]WEX11325.1 beta-ketoacyl-ACP synthase III [Chelativorans sp. AA-79]